MQTFKSHNAQITNLKLNKSISSKSRALRSSLITKQTLLFLWEGSPSLSQTSRLEWRFVAIRWLGILFLTPTLPHLNLSSGQLIGAYAVLSVAIIYNLALQVMLLRRTNSLVNGYIITICDGLLDIALIVVAGGFDSPFAYVLYTVVVGTAMRYGYGPVLAMAGLFICADIVESLLTGQSLDPAFLFRSGFLMITAMIAGYLAEQAQEAKEALEGRLHQANALNKELEAFSYSVSHDLRAPLRSIDGFSQALLEDYHDKLDDLGKDYLTRVCAASQRMAALIDDLLNLSRLTRSEINREPISLSTLAKSVAAKLQQMDPERKVEIIIADDITTTCDPRLLQVVLENLFANAWKFTGRSPNPKIEFGVTQIEGESAYFIRDNGVGFDMSYANKLFGAFQRLHSANEFEGNGIGLATVQRIIHRHGGQVWGESIIEQGATFYFTLK